VSAQAHCSADEKAKESQPESQQKPSCAPRKAKVEARKSQPKPRKANQSQGFEDFAPASRPLTPSLASPDPGFSRRLRREHAPGAGLGPSDV
jgi:hypothetical protein